MATLFGIGPNKIQSTKPYPVVDAFISNELILIHYINKYQK